ncbi:MAG: lipase family protein [Candidatus Paracaedibacter sp.]
MKPNKLKFLLISFCYISITPLWAAQQEILELRGKIKNITQRVQHNLDQYPNAQSVIILGPTGSGKSTFVNLLAGKPFIAQDGDRSYQVDTNNPLPDFNIQHQNIAGTRLPCSWYDVNFNILFWDCPGFGDPRGPQSDIINSFSIHQLFRQNTQILLVCLESLLDSRATNFLKLLNEMTALFPGSQDLKKSVSIIFSKQTRSYDIPTYLKNKILTLSQEDQDQLTLPVRDLLESLVTNPARISSLLSPTALGLYNPPMEPIKQAILATSYMNNPKPSINVSEGAILYINALGESLNGLITDYIRNQGNTSIIIYCDYLIGSHFELAGCLRETFRNFVVNLRKLQTLVTAQEPDLFPRGLTNIFGNQFFDTNEINQTIEQIQFFKGIHNTNITYHTADWTNALSPTIEYIEGLAKNPDLKKINDNTSTITGEIIGTSDIISDCAIIKVKSSKSLFIDNDIKMPGVDLFLKSPIFYVVGEREISLKGKDGDRKPKANSGDTPQEPYRWIDDYEDSKNRNGKDGEQGSTGYPGGKFRARGNKIFNASNLNIDVRGGNGGQGQDGGNGANGRKGKANRDDLTYPKEEYLISREKVKPEKLLDHVESWGKYFLTFNGKFREVYCTYALGEEGGAAGQGGVGGLGGESGTITEIRFDSSTGEPKIIKGNGQQGPRGQQGNKGTIGKGTLFKRTYINELVAPGWRGYDEFNRESSKALIGVGTGTGASLLAKQASQEIISKTGEIIVRDGTPLLVRSGKELAMEGGKVYLREGAKSGVLRIISPEKAARIIARGGEIITKDVLKLGVQEAGKASITVGSGFSLLASTASFLAGMVPTIIAQSGISAISANYYTRWETEIEKIRNEKEIYNYAINKIKRDSYKTLKKTLNENGFGHINEENIINLLENYLDDLNRDDDINNVTGFSLSQNEIIGITYYMNLCHATYTNWSTREFVAKQGLEHINKKWNGIIDVKNNIKRFCDNLESIRKVKESAIDVKAEDLVFIGGGIFNRVQVPDIGRHLLDDHTEKVYKGLIKEINKYLQIIGKQPINNDENIYHVINKLTNIMHEINSKYSWYFEKELNNTENWTDGIKEIFGIEKFTIPVFTDTNEQKHQLTPKGVIASSFLSKAGLLTNENITVMDVGFRNQERFGTLWNNFAETFSSWILRRNNPKAWFVNHGEVDYIAYIEKDFLEQGKDRLVIVYSGSNSVIDWGINLTYGHRVTCDGLSAHQGIGWLFDESINTYHSILKDRIKAYYNYCRKPKEFEIITTGHSLGAGLAELAAYHYKLNQKSFEEIIGLDSEKISVKTFTFAAPAIVHQKSKNSIEEKIEKNNIYRVWLDCDIIVTLTDGLFLQDGAHIGKNLPLYNIQNLPFNSSLGFRSFGDIHGASTYKGRLSLADPKNSPKEYEILLTILNNHIKSTKLNVYKRNLKNDYPNWSSLFDNPYYEVLLGPKILIHLDDSSLKNAAQVNKNWQWHVESIRKQRDLRQ